MSGTTETLTFRPKRQQRTETLALRRAHDERMDRAARRRQQLAQRHPATVARRLALAHRIAEEIDAGRYADQADVARHHGLTRARLTQLMNLLLLAPDIQEEVLALEYPGCGGCSRASSGRTSGRCGRSCGRWRGRFELSLSDGNRSKPTKADRSRLMCILSAAA